VPYIASGRGWLACDLPSTVSVLNITAVAWTAGFQWWHSGDIMRMQNVSEYMSVLALCLVGHIARMDDDADAKMILTAPPPDNWRRPPGRPLITNSSGSESPSVEAGVYIWCYALLVVHARKEEEKTAADSYLTQRHLATPPSASSVPPPVTIISHNMMTKSVLRLNN